jgi:hypothetical protein
LIFLKKVLIGKFSSSNPTKSNKKLTNYPTKNRNFRKILS